MAAMFTVDSVVIGAGVIGLATARALSAAGRRIVVLEEQPLVGSITSARNSEVIHSGIYYEDGSLKARLCLRGRDLLFRYAEERKIEHKKIGKLIVANSDDELAALERIDRRARAAGVTDLTFLTQAQATALEPQLKCLHGLLSPSTGIIDSHQLMLAYQADAEANGATFALNTKFNSAAATNNGFQVRFSDSNGETGELQCREIVNASGLSAQEVAAKIESLSPKDIPARYLSQGAYFTLTGGSPFERLIYPAPNEASLGIHLTLDLGGGARFGPDHEWLDEITYDPGPNRVTPFYDAIRRYWPDLKNGSLNFGFCGIRPKLAGPGEAAADFRIDGPAHHGAPGLVNLFGIESPGLTASLAIAEHVAALLDGI
jgi:L-2-hydroxyglutarate oxidase LhgO